MENQGSFSDADRHSEAAERKKPNHVNAIQQRGMLAMKAGNSDKRPPSFKRPCESARRPRMEGVPIAGH